MKQTRVLRSIEFGVIAKNSIVQASGANLLILGLTLVSGVVVARSLGSEGRGHYAAIMAWFGVALVLGELGQSGAVTFHVSRYVRWSKDLVASSRWLMGCASLLVTTAGLLASDILAEGNSGVAAAYRVAFVACFFNGIGAPFVYAMQATSIRTWNVIRLVQPGFYLLCLLLMVSVGRLDLFSLSVILLGSTTVQLIWAWRACSKWGLVGGNSRPKLMWALLKYGLAYSGSSLPLAASSQVDKIGLSRMVSPSDLGLYAVASTMASMAHPFSTAIASVLFPRVARRGIAHADKRSLENRSLALTLGVSLLISVAVASTAGWVIPGLFGADFTGASTLTWWLVPAMVLRGCSQVVSAHLRGHGRPGSVSWAQCAGLLFASIGTLTLTPIFGMPGTAMGVAASELVVLIWTYVVLTWVRGHAGDRGRSRSSRRERRRRKTYSS